MHHVPHRCLYVFKRVGVSYHVLLDVQRGVHNYHAILRASCTLMTIVFTAFAAFMGSLLLSRFDKHVFPLAAAASTAAFFLNPWDWMPEWKDAQQRRLLLRTVAVVYTAPFTRLTFGRTVIADVFTSMPKLFVDVLFSACLYSSGEEFSTDAQARHVYRVDACDPHSVSACLYSSGEEYSTDAQVSDVP